jgi:hypothetical protein
MVGTGAAKDVFHLRGCAQRPEHLRDLNLIKMPILLHD